MKAAHNSEIKAISKTIEDNHQDTLANKTAIENVEENINELASKNEQVEKTSII